MSNFCVESELTNPKCYTIQPIEFDSEENILDILLDVLKSELPARLGQVLGCDNRPLYINEDDIDLVYPEKEARFIVVLTPISETPEYSENLHYRTNEYVFEAKLYVVHTSRKCLTWEFIRFKNVVDGLLLGTDLLIDNYNSVAVIPRGFRWTPVLGDNNGSYRREGAYRFSVTVSQIKKN